MKRFCYGAFATILKRCALSNRIQTKLNNALLNMAWRDVYEWISRDVRRVVIFDLDVCDGLLLPVSLFICRAGHERPPAPAWKTVATTTGMLIYHVETLFVNSILEIKTSKNELVKITPNLKIFCDKKQLFDGYIMLKNFLKHDSLTSVRFW